jgi:acyl-CoA thioester hydrolase
MTPIAESGGFSWPVRVYYEDTDAAGVVYYATYLRYLERARTECLRMLGFSQQNLMQQHGVAFVVRHADVDYLKPARLDDELAVTVAVSSMGASVIVFSQRVLRAAELLIAARIKVACVRIPAFSPVRIPAAIRDPLGRATSWAQA